MISTIISAASTAATAGMASWTNSCMVLTTLRVPPLKVLFGKSLDALGPHAPEVIVDEVHGEGVPEHPRHDVACSITPLSHIVRLIGQHQIERCRRPRIEGLHEIGLKMLRGLFGHAV